MQVVAVDIGGTHARFALADVAGGRVQHLTEPVTLKTAEHASFQAAWNAFAACQTSPIPRAVAIAVACPVRGEVLRLTNNPWSIAPALLGEMLDVDAQTIVNDFEAVGHAVVHVGPEHFRHVCGLQGALSQAGVTTIVGPGTGLGVAMLVRDGGTYNVVPCEGGHADFAPLDSIDDAILADLRPRYGRVSVERIVSGSGLAILYGVLARAEGCDVPLRDDKDLWAVALDGSDRLASAALARFCLNLGAIAGDLALAHGPTAVVLAGGLGLRLADYLPRSGFAQRFTAKGRFAELMTDIPVSLITYPQPGLYGAAAAFAKEHAV